MAKLTVAELDDWANYWQRRLDALLAQPKAPKQVAIRKRGRRPPLESSKKCQVLVSKNDSLYVQRIKANRLSGKSEHAEDSANSAGQHQTRRFCGSPGFQARQEALVVATAASDPEGREV